MGGDDNVGGGSGSGSSCWQRSAPSPTLPPRFLPPPPTPSFASRALSLSFYFIFSIHPPSFLHHQPPPPFPPGPHPNPRFLLSLIPASSFLPPRTAALRAVLGMK